MPFSTGHKSEDEIEDLYHRFFKKSKDILTNNGTIIMYSHNPELVRESSFTYKYDVLDEFEIIKKDNAWLFIIRWM